MIKIRRYFNRNTTKILVSILVVIVVIIVIQLLNKSAKKIEDNNTVEDIVSYKQRDTIISNEKVEKEKNEEISKVIFDFIEKCNNKKVEEAYDMISSACKEYLYPDINTFTRLYYNQLFKGEKQINIKSWVTKNDIYTYKVTFFSNIMSLVNESQIEDYYSIVKENGNLKLNINGLIEKKQLNKEKETSEIKVKLNDVYIFMDYEIYDVEVSNYTNKKIILDSKQKTDTMYIVDNNDNKYPSQNYELSEMDLQINVKTDKKFKIKYSKAYSSKLNTKKVVFSDIKYATKDLINNIEIDT